MTGQFVRFNTRRKKMFLEALRQGARRGAAAESVGVKRQTVWYAMHGDSEFAEQVEQAELDANELIEDALFKAAKSGNVIACQVWLYNRMAGRWRDQRNVNVKIDLTEYAQQLAVELGIDPQEAIQEAERIIHGRSAH